MSDKFRLCGACGQYILVHTGAVVKDINGYWFVHRNRSCSDDSEIIAEELSDEAFGEITGFRVLANGQVQVKTIWKDKYEPA